MLTTTPMSMSLAPPQFVTKQIKSVPTVPMQRQMSPGARSSLPFHEIVGQFNAATVPTFSREACENLPEDIPLRNFIKEDYGNVLYRC